MNAYMMFSNQHRAAVAQANPALTSTEISSKLGAAWNALTQQDREPYELKAQADRVRFQRERANAQPHRDRSPKPRPRALKTRAVTELVERAMRDTAVAAMEATLKAVAQEELKSGDVTALGELFQRFSKVL